MTTETKLTAMIIDAVNTNPNGFTLNIQTGELFDHGFAVGGYHQDHGFSYKRDWIRLGNDGASFTVSFEMLFEQIEQSWDAIEQVSHIGGWLNDGVLVLDLVEVFDCIACTVGDADATPFLEGSRLEQEAIGWLCPKLFNGYKTVGVNF